MDHQFEILCLCLYSTYIRGPSWTLVHFKQCPVGIELNIKTENYSFQVLITNNSPFYMFQIQRKMVWLQVWLKFWFIQRIFRRFKRFKPANYQTNLAEPERGIFNVQLIVDITNCFAFFSKDNIIFLFSFRVGHFRTSDRTHDPGRTKKKIFSSLNLMKKSYNLFSCKTVINLYVLIYSFRKSQICLVLTKENENM